jgi:signal peptidase I
MRGSLAIPHVPAVRPRLRLPHAKALAFVAAQLGLVAVLLWFALPQGLGGRAGWVLVSGTSMLPHLHTGDLVLVERRSSYHVGDVVAYHVPKGQVGAGHVVIHRIVGGNPRAGWKMQGDNRTAPDLWYPRNQDVVGAKFLRIPNAWLVLRFFHTPLFLGLLAAIGAFFLLVLGPDEEEASSDERGS